VGRRVRLGRSGRARRLVVSALAPWPGSAGGWAAANPVVGSAVGLAEPRDHERPDLRPVPACHNGAASNDHPAGADLDCAGGGDVAVAGPGRAGLWRLYRRVAPWVVDAGWAGLLHTGGTGRARLVAVRRLLGPTASGVVGKWFCHQTTQQISG